MHVVPGENGLWTVVDLQRRGRDFSSKAAALDYAKRLAAAYYDEGLVREMTLDHEGALSAYKMAVQANLKKPTPRHLEGVRRMQKVLEEAEKPNPPPDSQPKH